jgi:cobalamin biosynthesis protein CobD/CbiB
LAAVGGVLLTSVIDAQYAGTEEGFQQLVAIFDNRPVLLVVAAVFGLAPDLIIRRLQQQVDKYKGDLQSTQSSQSRADVSKIASRQTSSGDPQLTS